MNRTVIGRFRPRLGVCLAGALIFAGSFLAVTPVAQADSGTKIAAVRPETAPATVPNGGVFMSFAPLVKQVAPSVVKVSITVQAKAAAGPGIPDLGQLFGIPGGQQNPSQQLQAPKQHGVGSGVIVTKDGYILTNNHVVENAETIKVEMNDGREFIGKVIGRDPKTDIAVIKIEANDLPFLALADSDKIEIGDVVLAVGNPFGIGQTVTTGIVSAKGRATMGLDYEDFIQTDAAINPGNSGGALVDTHGELVGINTAILSESGGNQGIGFAVPANLAHWVMTSLVKDGRVERGFLGVNIQDMTPELATQFKVSKAQGALVSGVTPDSPADKAGLKSGDVIVDFNGKAVTDSRHLRLQVAETLPGSSVPMRVMRDGAGKMLSITVKEMPGDKVALGPASSGDTTGDALHGVAVADLDAASRTQLKVPAQIQGALISQVAPNSASYEAGLRPGDVIMEINRKPVNSAEQAVAATAKPAGNETLLHLWSQGGSRYVVVDEVKAG